MKYFFGVISKNQVDSVIQYSLEHKNTEITFIPSRRQIEYNGGYVNNWTTETFTKYIKVSNPKIKIERDHSGPGQGLYDDDGYISLQEDCKYFDIIHIDPWKKYPILNDGIKWTISMIRFCYNLNPNIIYEIGTEEAIREFTVNELEDIIRTIKRELPQNIYKNIKYCVVQCGNRLCNGKNSGVFEECKLSKMITLVSKYDLISKEHNGDWVSVELIKKKQDQGLECINIAPELGMIESKIILGKIKNNKEHYDKVYELCYKSDKWKKWVAVGFDMERQKDDLILITCHYIFSQEKFQEIKNCYIGIDTDIKNDILDKLLKLNFIYEQRQKCICCDSNNVNTIFKTDYKTPLSLVLSCTVSESFFMPYNVLLCNMCNTFQTKYVGNLSIVYNTNHIDDYGTIKTEKHRLFCDFICVNKNINGIVEVGSCNGVLGNNIMEIIKTEYNIIEPSYIGNKTGLNIITDFFENVNLTCIESNTLIMSDVFEHFYNPIGILNKIKNSPNIEYIYLNHPDFDYSIKNNIYINLNSEHTFLIKHQFLFSLFEKYGFSLTRRYDYSNFSLFLEFKKMRYDVPNEIIIKESLFNYNLKEDVTIYFDNIFRIVQKINNYVINNPKKSFYIWPTSIHSIPLFTMGINYEKFTGVLDNSPNKVGKFIYGYNLPCSSLNTLLENGSSNVCVFISGAGNYIKELDLKNTKIEVIFVDDMLESCENKN